MPRSHKRRRRRSLLGLLVLLLFFLLFKLNPFLAGVLPGGGRWESDPKPDPIQQGMIQILVVRGPQKSPVEGATVHLASLEGERQSTKSDTDGKARFEGLAAQPYRIDAEGNGDIASAWSEPGRSVTMRMRSPPMRRGMVRGKGGTPAAGTAFLLDRDAHVLASDQVARDGRYTLPADDRGHAVCFWPDYLGAPGATFKGDIIVGDGELVRGRLVVEGIPKTFEVFALIPDRTEDRLVPLRALWDAHPDGSYEGLLPIGARAWIVHEGVPYPVGVTATSAARGVIEGGVTDIAKRPLEGVTVYARPLREGLPIEPFPLAATATGSDGKFRFDPIGEGSYSLELNAPGRARMVIHQASTGSPPITIVMTRGFRIRGRVIDPDGRPLHGVDIFALATPDPTARFPEAHTRTATDGRFVLDRIGGDYARLRVHMADYHDVTMLRVGRNGNVTIRLKAGG